jgi:hypothetical protein
LHQPWQIILLHVWGFLGDVTWALPRTNSVVHFYVSLATQQFKRRAYPQHCYVRDNGHGNVFMITGLLSSDCCLQTSIDRVSRVWKSPTADVRVFGYGLLLVGRLS